MATTPPLHGMRIIECSALGPAQITTPLVDLGADVIKIEPPAGDYIREMTWPIVEGTSLMHLHLNRGKRSLVLDLRTEEGVAIMKELAAAADAVVEAMRPGSLARRGVGFDDLKEINPKIVFCTISGYGMTGPYRDYPATAWPTTPGPASSTSLPTRRVRLHPRARVHRDPCRSAFRRARHPGRGDAGPGHGEGSYLDLAQSDAAAAMDWLRSETWRAYERPESEVTGNKAGRLRTTCSGHRRHGRGVRYQVYETADHQHVLFMASEQAFWRNFCEGVERMDLFERWPGSKYADHARGDRELQHELRDIFRTKTAEEWLEFGGRHQHTDRAGQHAQDIARGPPVRRPVPLAPGGGNGSRPALHPAALRRRGAPASGQGADRRPHTEDVLRSVLGYDDNQIWTAPGGGRSEPTVGGVAGEREGLMDKVRLGVLGAGTSRS